MNDLSLHRCHVELQSAPSFDGLLVTLPVLFSWEDWDKLHPPLKLFFCGVVGLKPGWGDRTERAVGRKYRGKPDVWETVGLPVLIFLLAQQGWRWGSRPPTERTSWGRHFLLRLKTCFIWCPRVFCLLTTHKLVSMPFYWTSIGVCNSNHISIVKSQPSCVIYYGTKITGSHISSIKLCGFTSKLCAVGSLY